MTDDGRLILVSNRMVRQKHIFWERGNGTAQPIRQCRLLSRRNRQIKQTQFPALWLLISAQIIFFMAILSTPSIGAKRPLRAGH